MHTYDNSPKHIHTHELFMKHTEPILVNENLDRFTHISTIKIKQIHRQAKHTHTHTHTHTRTYKKTQTYRFNSHSYVFESQTPEWYMLYWIWVLIMSLLLRKDHGLKYFVILNQNENTEL